MPSEHISLDGHIIDSLTLPKTLDAIVAAGADYTILELNVGREQNDMSHAELEIRSDDAGALESLLIDLQTLGVNRIKETNAETEVTDVDGVLPPGFYSTTNLPTEVLIDGEWLTVENPEMDCGLIITSDNKARTIPMHRVKSGDRIVVGDQGVRVTPLSKPRGQNAFEFMDSEVSSEKPKAIIVEQVADRIRAARERGAKVLAVCGPAVIHTGAGPAVARMVKAGYVNVLFAGNGFATHDIESNVLGTSLGVPMTEHSRGGHSNHVRVVNEVRRFGSIAAAIDAGYIDGGVMYECTKAGVPFVLAGSLRDDGPLPDVQTNVVEAADTMRYLIPDVEVALMLATTLHAIATGNILPATVETFCVDINPAVVTKLTDRGSHQAVGIVTDTGLFISELADALGA
jgi:lysine-ketoglutarate reductase/saccharopine dehydrogenase-like protein (TIGR00300 family)